MGLPKLLEGTEKESITGAVWMPDGKSVVYSQGVYTAASALNVVSIGTGKLPDRLPYAAYSPALSRRGNRLAYVQGMVKHDFWLIEPGKPTRSFANSTRLEMSPQFSPDGRRVAFSSDRSGLMQIWACDMEGRNEEQLSHFEEGESGSLAGRRTGGLSPSIMN